MVVFELFEGMVVFKLLVVFKLVVVSELFEGVVIIELVFVFDSSKAWSSLKCSTDLLLSGST